MTLKEFFQHDTISSGNTGPSYTTSLGLHRTSAIQICGVTTSTPDLTDEVLYSSEQSDVSLEVHIPGFLT